MTIVWKPKHPETTNMWQFMQKISEITKLPIEHYETLYQWSITSPEIFWKTLSDFFKFPFHEPPTTILQPHKIFFKTRWFEGASFNFSEALLKGSPEKEAIVSIRETGEIHRLTFYTLREKVAKCQTALKNRGFLKGMRVAAILPNTEEAIIVMLATASLGGIFSACAPEFGIEATLDRLHQIKPSFLFITDGHVYQGKKQSGLAKIQTLAKNLYTLSTLIIVSFIGETIPRSSLKDTIVFEDFLKNEANNPYFQSLPFNHPLYILFSSGTTGKPKCIVHGQGGTLLQHLKELGLHTDIHATDNLCFYTTTGWMMWNWMVSALALEATLTLYEGSPMHPTPLRLFECIDKEKITVFGTSAKFLSEIQKKSLKPANYFPIKTLRTLLTTGSPLLPEQYDYVYQEIKTNVQLSSISGGSDIISCFALGNSILPVYRGELQCIGLGMKVQVFNQDGKSMIDKKGELVCTAPFPSMPLYFWGDKKDDSAYHHAYFERFKNVWTHGDFAKITHRHTLIIYGRSDATLNPGGVRIGTAEIYRQLEKIPDILDSVAVSQHYEGDTRIILFVKMRPGVHLDETFRTRIANTIRLNASPRHVPAKILEVSDIPRTMNGKVMEMVIKHLIHHEPIGNVSMLMNPKALDDFKDRPELLT